MTNRSNIRILKPSEFTLGLCGVCDRNVIVKFRCDATGTTLGDCCVESFLSADRLLTGLSKFVGICHPEPVIPNT